MKRTGYALAAMQSVVLLVGFSQIIGMGHGIQILAGLSPELDTAQAAAKLPFYLGLTAGIWVALGALVVARVLHALGLPWADAGRVSRAWKTVSKQNTPTSAQLLAVLLDEEAAHGGFQLRTVEAFAHHAELEDWASRAKVLRAWLRLQQSQLDTQLTAGHTILDTPEGRVPTTDWSMRLSNLDTRLRPVSRP
jgi:hypothetical protein